MSSNSAAFYRDIRKLPNLLCLYRLVAILIAVAIFFLGHPLLSLALGITAGLTDYFDGYFARKWNQVTELGALLDTVADLLFAFACITLAIQIEVWPLYLLYLWAIRDISVLTLRASAAQQGFTIPSIFLGKLASNFIFYSLCFFPLDYAAPFGQDHWFSLVARWIGLFGIHAGLAMQWITAFHYLRRYIQNYQPQAPKAAHGAEGSSE
ncbi:MAG: CDP-alcohol phosphatidyltransferase family protein [Myxococcota bacterium]|jgi:CDP-diacylglycerol--glycerol-3-phosphate 3-phosphatidyltransferase|nr:CDP-alcohol phosphatidyltransferase family protein [Myxococcota bacterium]